MALYKYTKEPVKARPFLEEPPPEEDVIIIKRKPPRQLTLWDILSGLFADLNELVISSKVAGIMVPVVLILFGVSIIFNQIWPDVEQQIKYTSGYYDTYNVPLVEGEYVDRAKYISNPGAEYFRQLAQDAEQAHVLEPDPISNSYSGRFSLSIPSLELSNLPVTANVESGVEEVYDTVLETGLAHFKDTMLPISEKEGNTVIYGHSSSGDYFDRTNDVAGAFSKLHEVKIGDEVIVEMDGKTYKYRISRSKIVEPHDVSIVTGQVGKDTLTLFTCFPNGNSARRFVAIANPVSEV